MEVESKRDKFTFSNCETCKQKMSVHFTFRNHGATRRGSVGPFCNNGCTLNSYTLPGATLHSARCSFTRHLPPHFSASRLQKCAVFCHFSCFPYGRGRFHNEVIYSGSDGLRAPDLPIVRASRLSVSASLLSVFHHVSLENK